MEPKVSKSAQESNKQQSTLTKSEGWSGVHHQLYEQQECMNKWILLNNKPIVTIFWNPDMVEGIQKRTTNLWILSPTLEFWGSLRKQPSQDGEMHGSTLMQ
jgi:hypothetical protein